MNVWLDIHDVNHIFFYKEIKKVLVKQGHSVTITAVDRDEIKERLLKLQLSAVYFHEHFPLLKLLRHPLSLFRAKALVGYLKSRKIDIALSLDSLSMCYTASYLNIPLVLLLLDDKSLPGAHYISNTNCFYIVPDSVSEEKLLREGIDLDLVTRYKGDIQETVENYKLIHPIENISKLLEDLVYIIKVNSK